MQNFQIFIKFLELSLKKPLPGINAQLLIAPKINVNQTLKNNKEHAKKSSILILIYPDAGEIMTVLIQRPKYHGVHSGQISFPGGKFEKCDKNIIQTALREANEEIGINISEVEILGNLSELYIPPSNFIVTPVVAYTNIKPEFKIDKKEVVETIEIKLSELQNKNTVQKKTIEVRGTKMEVPCYFIQEKIIWGATAMIISELLKLLDV